MLFFWLIQSVTGSTFNILSTYNHWSIDGMIYTPLTVPFFSLIAILNALKRFGLSVFKFGALSTTVFIAHFVLFITTTVFFIWLYFI